MSQNQRRGPGSHNITIPVGDFSEYAVVEKARGPNWQQALNVAKFNAIPHMFFRAQHEHNLFLVRLDVSHLVSKPLTLEFLF